jgi:hypothetical protein
MGGPVSLHRMLEDPAVSYVRTEAARIGIPEATFISRCVYQVRDGGGLRDTRTNARLRARRERRRATP